MLLRMSLSETSKNGLMISQQRIEDRISAHVGLEVMAAPETCTSLTCTPGAALETKSYQGEGKFVKKFSPLRGEHILQKLMGDFSVRSLL